MFEDFQSSSSCSHRVLQVNWTLEADLVDVSQLIRVSPAVLRPLVFPF